MRAGRQRGYTYVWLLAAVALLSLGLAELGPRWAEQARREREGDLLRIGSLYARAIATYYAASPGSLKQYPARLDDLLADTRMVGTIRYLRRLYPDPIDPTRPWGLVLDASGRIRGVYSLSAAAPLRVAAWDDPNVTLDSAQRYSEWKFIAKVPQ